MIPIIKRILPGLLCFATIHAYADSDCMWLNGAWSGTVTGRGSEANSICVWQVVGAGRYDNNNSNNTTLTLRFYNNMPHCETYGEETILEGTCSYGKLMLMYKGDYVLKGEIRTNAIGLKNSANTMRLDKLY